MMVDAVYENGVLRPLQPLDLPEHEHVTVSVTKVSHDPGVPQVDLEFIECLRRGLLTAGPPPGIEEVRRRLAKISGSMAADFITEREDG
jgi:predicted DNA-binding antitoxin AbrB/MazE fold protein